MLSRKQIERIESCWSEKTAGIFDKNNPSKHQCFVTSLLVNDLVGGRFAFLNSPRHLWNILPDGSHVDLTRQQFKTKVDFSPFTVISRCDVLRIGNFRTGNLTERYVIMRDNYMVGEPGWAGDDLESRS